MKLCRQIGSALPESQGEVSGVVEIQISNLCWKFGYFHALLRLPIVRTCDSFNAFARLGLSAGILPEPIMNGMRIITMSQLLMALQAIYQGLQ